MQRVLLLGLLIGVVMVPGPGRTQEPAGQESCVGKVRLRGPIWDITANELEPGLGDVLDRVASLYQQRCLGKLVVIESHAYALPTPELNEKLADLRAAVVRHELSKRGVPASEMVVAPIGERRPMFPGSGPDAAERNRRITFRIAN